MREVIVFEEVYNLLWQKLEKPYFDKMVERLFERLEKHYERLKKLRHPEDETLFICRLYMAQGDNWHTFEFRVDDTMADTNLFVVGVHHELGKIGI